MSKPPGVLLSSAALAVALLAICFAVVARGADQNPPAQMPPPRPVEIDRNSVLILVRTTLIALQQANQTNNYSVFYGISAPGFQSVNSADRLSQIFAKLRASNFDLSGVVVLEPQFTVMPEIYANNTLRMAGFFPSVPLQVYFDLQFTPVGGQWRVVAISVDVGGATPAAPTPNPALATPAPANADAKKAEPAKAAAVDVNVKPKESQSGTKGTEVRPATKATPTPH